MRGNRGGNEGRREAAPRKNNLETGAGFLLGGLLLHLGVDGAHRFSGSGSALFAPAFENFTVFFEIRECERIFEHRAESEDDGLEAFPNDPLLSRVFEEEVFIDQAAI